MATENKIENFIELTPVPTLRLFVPTQIYWVNECMFDARSFKVYSASLYRLWVIAFLLYFI